MQMGHIRSLSIYNNNNNNNNNNIYPGSPLAHLQPAGTGLELNSSITDWPCAHARSQEEGSKFCISLLLFHIFHELAIFVGLCHVLHNPIIID